jgi:hypothetical protein
VVGFQLDQHREIPGFGVGEVATEDHCHRLTAPYVIAEYDRNLPDDPANERCDMHLMVLVWIDDARNAKRAGGLIHVQMYGLNLCFLQVVRTKLDLQICVGRGCVRCVIVRGRWSIGHARHEDVLTWFGSAAVLCTNPKPG